MKPFIYAVLLAVAATKANAQSDISTAKWLPHPVSIDGKATEWNEPLNFYDAGTRLFFAIANDSTNLYLCFESRDEQSQAKLMRGGMKITLTSKGKPRHEASIAYPLTQKATAQQIPAQDMPAGSDGRMHDRSSFRQYFLTTHNQFDAQGFATANGTLPLTNPTGLTAALGWDTASSLIYEIAIPKKEFFGADYQNPEATAPTLTLDVVLNALPKDDAPGDNRNYPSHGDHPHGEGAPGGHRGQFNGGGYNTGNDELKPDPAAADGADVSLHSKSSFKQKFVLAKAG